MECEFKASKALVVNNAPASQKIIVGVLRVLGFQAVESAYEASDGYRAFKEKNHNIIIGELLGNGNDGIALTKKIRASADSPNPDVPILVIAGSNTLNFLESAREAGISDLLRVPYSVDDVTNKLTYLLQANNKDLIRENIAYKNKIGAAQTAMSAESNAWPTDEESTSLTDLLLDHYIKHHEIVFSKLKFSRDATKNSIDELRVTHKKIKDKSSSSIQEFKDFDAMWDKILQMFVQGGISEDDLTKIESVITKVPDDIKKHYNDLTQQDKNFLTLVESLNHNAYQKAREKVTQLQKTPNPLNGKTSEDYKIIEDDVLRAQKYLL